MDSSYFLLNQVRTHYLKWNAESAARPLVLLHGLAEGARLWQKTAPLLAEAGYRILAPDLRGHGATDSLGSEAGEIPDEMYRLDTFVMDTAAFLEYAQIEKPLLVGHGMGAAVALEYAARVSWGPRSPAGLALVEGGLLNSGRKRLADTIGSPDGLTVEAFMQHMKASQSRWQPDEQDLQVLLSYFEIDEDETIMPRLTGEQEARLRQAEQDFKAHERLQTLKCPLLMVAARPPAPLSDLEERDLAEKKALLARAGELNQKLKTSWLEDCVNEAPLHKPQELARLLIDFAAGLPE